MDREWMRAQLEEFARVADAASRSIDQSQDPAWIELRRQEFTAKRILEALARQFGGVDLKLVDFDTDPLSGASDARNAAQRGLGILGALEDVDERLRPDAPTLPADRLHPWVWEAARPLWDSKHYRAAVDAAARVINANTQTKIDRQDTSNTDLMNQAFSGRARPGQKYLRIQGDPTDRTIGNRNRALRPFAEGCFAGIRALAAHETGPDWDEQRALESLATLSILAGWIDECEVVIAS